VAAPIFIVSAATLFLNLGDTPRPPMSWKQDASDDCRGGAPASIIRSRPPAKGSSMDGEWLTYAEAAEVMRIKPDSVKRRARARNWPRRLGNDGLARVQLPPPDASGDTSPHDDPPLSARLAVAENEARLLRERVADLMTERDRLLSIIEASHTKIVAVPTDGGRLRRALDVLLGR
jgi:hypothetical protein